MVWGITLLILAALVIAAALWLRHRERLQPYTEQRIDTHEMFNLQAGFPLPPRPIPPARIPRAREPETAADEWAGLETTTATFAPDVRPKAK